ncbi:MAG: hypothetical protein JRG91_14140, partial [Deltaproteobacteria bacterium]|nr:hypothetical protein [Deltaproteobacteria bacterium]
MSSTRPLVWIAAASFALAACGKKGDGDGPGTTPVTLDPSDFTYTLEESTSALPLWTTPCTHKVRTHERPPEATRSGLHASAARREFEPVQILLGPGSGSVTVEIDPFPDLGAAQRLEVAEAGYEDGWAEHLTPVAPGGSVGMSGDRAVPVWITIRVPVDAPAGEHTTTLHLTRSGTTVDVPVSLYVFDFEIPAEVGFASQMNVSVSDLVGGGSVDDAKTLLIEHRFTPKSVTWPSGFNWGITWENDRSTDPCGVLWDEPDEPDEYAIGWLARRYILGEGWNGAGFPNAMIFQFVDNSTPRPSTFCGISRGDHHGSDAYNAEWSEFLSALEAYLRDGGMIDKAYYYVQNEPQDDEDHALAAFLCDLVETAAPDLRIAVS